MTDRDGNAIEMHRDELRAIARSALALLGPSKQDAAPKKIDAA